MQLSIFHNDGNCLAKVKGSQIYPTKDGKKAGIVMHYPVDGTVCKLNGRAVFELKRSGPAAWKGWAELYTPNGIFVKGTDTDLASFGIDISGNQTQLGNMLLSGNRLDGAQVGLL